MEQIDRRTLLAVGGAALAPKAAAVAGYREEPVTVTVAGVEVACRLGLPAGRPRGAILMLPGSLYVDVDGNLPALKMFPHTTADMARQLGERGFATLRMAKIGPGTGSRTLDPALAARHGEFGTRVEVALAGLALLHGRVKARPVIVAGHSEGAVVASLSAARPEARIDGLVSLSGPATPILTIMREQVAESQPAGRPADLHIFDRAIAAVRAGEPLPPEARNDPMSGMLATMPPAALHYLRTVDAVDPVAALATVRVPVLIVQGGRDTSVRPAHADRLAAGRAGRTTEVARFPALTHFYKVAPAGLDPMQSMMLAGDTDPAVADAIARWARRLGR